MAEYIEREALRRAVFDASWQEHTDEDVAYDVLESIPTADVEPVRHARWEWDNDAFDWGLGAWVCSECYARNNNINARREVNPNAWVGSHYCPNCGARMDLE